MSFKKEQMDDKRLYKFEFQIRDFDSNMEVNGVSSMKTNPITHARCMELIKKDLALYKNKAGNKRR